MTITKTFALLLAAGMSSHVLAAEFSFDRPGAGFNTGITPVGKLAWEQGLPSATYTKSNDSGVETEQVSVNADMLLRTGLAKDLELRLGWDGPAWNKTKRAGNSVEEHGLGDVSIGLKKAIDLHDDRLTMAVLAEAILATGNDEFTHHDDIYSLSSAVAYAYDDILTTSITMRYEIQNSNLAVMAVPTIGYKLTDKLSGFSEFVYRKAESEDHEASLATGLIYAVNNRMQLDASVGVDLNSMNKGYKSGLGVSFLF